MQTIFQKLDNRQLVGRLASLLSLSLSCFFWLVVVVVVVAVCCLKKFDTAFYRSETKLIFSRLKNGRPRLDNGNNRERASPSFSAPPVSRLSAVVEVRTPTPAKQAIGSKQPWTFSARACSPLPCLGCFFQDFRLSIPTLRWRIALSSFVLSIDRCTWSAIIQQQQQRR